MSLIKFQDFESEYVSVLPTKANQCEKKFAHGKSQTKEISHTESSTQCANRAEIGLQTDDDIVEKEFAHCDNEKVIQFLRSVEPMIMKAIKENIRTLPLFLSRDMALSMNQEFAANLTHSLKHSGISDAMEVLSVSYNATGTTLACAIGHSEHDDWCEHGGWLCCWNTERSTLDPLKADTAIDLSCCATYVCFHPEKPALLAGGSFIGQLFIWNLAAADPVAITLAEQGDEVTGDRIISASYDGKLLIWCLPKTGYKLQLLQSFIIVGEYLPKISKIHQLGKEIGITSFALSAREPDMFVVGSEPGGIFQCSFTSKETVAEYITEDHNVPIYSPVTMNLQPRRGQISAVEQNPFCKSLIATACVDGTVCIYNILKVSPIHTIDLGTAVTDLRWSPRRPTVFAVTTDSGGLFFYDLLRYLDEPVLRVDTSGKDLHMNCACFNPYKADVLVTGDNKGVVKIWKLSSGFSNVMMNETEILENLDKSTDQD